MNTYVHAIGPTSNATIAAKNADFYIHKTDKANETQNKEAFKFREWNLSCKLYIGNLGDKADKYKIENVFKNYGQLKNVWVAKNPPGFAFIEYHDSGTTERVFKEVYDIKDLDKQMATIRFSGHKKEWDTHFYHKPICNIKPPTEDRPGDWLCPKEGCFNVNFSWRETCNKCNTRNPAIKETKEERRLRVYGNNRPERGRGGLGVYGNNRPERGRGGHGRDNNEITVRISNRESMGSSESHMHYRGQSDYKRGRGPLRTRGNSRSWIEIRDSIRSSERYQDKNYGRDYNRR